PDPLRRDRRTARRPARLRRRSLRRRAPAGGARGVNPRRGLLLAAGIAVVVLLALAIAAAVLMQPRQLARIALGSLGNALGLELAFEGDARYRLRGTPLLEVRDVVVREPGAREP